MSECMCENKLKHREEKEYKALINRLNRIEGQIRGIKNMIGRDAYCTDILIQVKAVQSALDSFNKKLLTEHINTCVVNNIKSGNDEIIDELIDTLQKLMK